MGSKPRASEWAIRLVTEKERAIYWLCALLERDDSATPAQARQALAELGYDKQRIDAMLLLGEPGRRSARESARKPVGARARRAAGARSRRPR